jgi:hypothetical protein
MPVLVRKEATCGRAVAATRADATSINEYPYDQRCTRVDRDVLQAGPLGGRRQAAALCNLATFEQPACDSAGCAGCSSSGSAGGGVIMRLGDVPVCVVRRCLGPARVDGV